MCSFPRCDNLTLTLGVDLRVPEVIMDDDIEKDDHIVKGCRRSSKVAEDSRR